MNLSVILCLLLPCVLALHPSIKYRPNIPKYATNLKGIELTNYINNNQNLWVAESSSFSAQEKKARTSNIKFLKSNSDEEIRDHHSFADIPVAFDARENWPQCTQIGHVRDQSDCGSSSHLVAAEIASDRTCIFSNGTFNLPLSAEDPLECCVGILSACGDGWGCDGSWPQDILKWWQTHGLCTGGNYEDQIGCKPYSIYPCEEDESNSTTLPPCPGYHTPQCEKQCKGKWPIEYLKDKHFGKEHYKVGKKMTEIQSEIMKNGPVIASFILYEDFWDYKSGIYVHTGGDSDGGMVTKIIGWGVDDGVPYWLCVHQWGKQFGDNGTFKILRSVNECNIEHQVIAALPDLDKHN